MKRVYPVEVQGDRFGGTAIAIGLWSSTILIGVVFVLGLLVGRF